MKTVVIIGGMQSDTFKKLGAKRGVKVEHHNGKTGGGRVETAFRKLVNKADVIILLEGALKHQSMWVVREMAEKLGKKINYHSGFGGTGALDKAIEMLQ
ncbi:DUF2325 domain-containing protein [Paenibacillus sp. Leaf72]|uniref:DUF2325 domain-containing protein n=1 Tax=Paenibacillus sp. Leaf72 TaxID=1736234 RepID=UPI000702075D|nr:DUF2325 domain-containing protein [Paenibacillus sp. Leaf72]KQN96960.1 hypothetical protein ASF12_23100 [Paenibacillus sp. Leaf72]